MILFSAFKVVYAIKAEALKVVMSVHDLKMIVMAMMRT